MTKPVKILLVVALAVPVLLFSAMLVTGITPLALGMHDPVQTREGVAAGGLDVVSFFAADAPMPGSSEHVAEWGGATWWFASAENQAAFVAAPEKYAPQCGGFCAFAATKGFAADSDPSSYAVHQDKLYFFAEPDVKSAAMEDPAAFVASCASFQ